MNMNKKERLAELSLVLVTIIWGSGFVATEYVIQANWTTSLIMVARFVVASLILGIILNKEIIKITKEELISGLIAGTLLFLGFYTQTVGQTKTNVSNVVFLTATNVIMIPFISWLISKNRPKLQTIVLTFLVLFGVSILSFEGGNFSLNLGDVFVLLGAFFFASQIAYLEKATKDSEPLRVNFIQILSATILSLVSFGIEGQGLAGASIKDGLMPVLFLGIFSTCICFFLQTRAQKYVSAVKVGIILSLEGVFGGLFSVVLGLEPLTSRLIVGGGLIILASILSNIDFGQKLEEIAAN
ncbi:MAG: DMT family transporter [Clostridiales bacterium]|nr:DMT family transporter [Clostridiales bacterium]